LEGKTDDFPKKKSRKIRVSFLEGDKSRPATDLVAQSLLAPSNTPGGLREKKFGRKKKVYRGKGGGSNEAGDFSAVKEKNVVLQENLWLHTRGGGWQSGLKSRSRKYPPAGKGKAHIWGTGSKT